MEYEKSGLMRQRMKNMKIEADISLNENNYDDAIEQNIKIMHNLIGTNASQEQVFF